MITIDDKNIQIQLFWIFKGKSGLIIEPVHEIFLNIYRTQFQIYIIVK